MKSFFRLIAIIPLLLFIGLTALGAQTPEFPDVSTLTPDDLLRSTIEPLFALIVLASGYISAFIPGLKKLEPFYRVLAFALAAGIGFHLYGVSFWKIASTYFLSSGLYVIFLRNMFPSPKAVAG